MITSAPTADTGLLLTVPADQVPPDFSKHNSAFQHAARLRLCRPVCDHGNRCKNKKRDGTECGAALDKEDTTLCETKLRTLRDEPAIVQTSKSLWTTPAIDPENGARMDVRISKTGVQNADEFIDVQVTSRSAWRQLVLWAKQSPSPRARSEQNTDPLSSPRPSLRPTGRIGPILKAFLAKNAPEDQQARATWLQEAMRRISCVLQIHNARIIAKCNGTI